MLYLSTLVNSVASDATACKECIEVKVKASGDKNENDKIKWTDNSCRIAKSAAGDKDCKENCKEGALEEAAPDCTAYFDKLTACDGCVKEKLEETADKDKEDNQKIDWTDKSCGLAKSAVEEEAKCKMEGKCSGVAFEDAAPNCKDYLKKLKKEECKGCVEEQVKDKGEKKNDETINWTFKSCKVANESLKDGGDCKNDCKEAKMNYKEAAPKCVNVEKPTTTSTTATTTSTSATTTTTQETGASYAYKAEVSMFLAMMTLGVSLMAIL